MSDDLSLPDRDDARAIWVFTADLDPEAFKTFVRPGETWPLAEALGLSGLSPAAVETFEAADLVGYGLERYLTEAHGMDPASVSPDSARLAALSGPVVLLFNRGLPEGVSRLDPGPPLVFVGRYDAPWHLVPATPAAPRPSTRGHIPGPAGPEPDPGALRRPLIATLAVLILLAVVIVALA